jgi:signal transduction histidine kinase
MRARRLADDALELARDELSVGPRAPVAFGEVAETTADLVDGVEVRAADEAWLRADRERLVRLLETLFLDARDRSEGDADVHVEVGVADGSTLYVADDAPPLPEDRRESAFDLGRSGEAGEGALLEPADGGTPGLGLAVAGEIAAAHGWAIDVVTAADGEVRFELGEVTTLESGDPGQ